MRLAIAARGMLFIWTDDAGYYEFHIYGYVVTTGSHAHCLAAMRPFDIDCEFPSIYR